MELKRYGTILRRRWYVIVFAIAVTTGLTYLLQSSKTPMYTSTGTLQVSCTAQDLGDWNSCNAVLTNNPQILGTYASLANSDLIQREVAPLMPGANLSDYTVSASVETDSTIVSVSVMGPNKQHVLTYTRELMDQMALWPQQNDPGHKLTTFDAPEAATRPDGTSKKLVLAIAVFLGFFLGLGVALFMEYLGKSDEREQARDIIDEATGVHNERYLRRRLLEETSRARRSGHGFTFAVLTVALPGGEDGQTAHVPPVRALRSLARGLDATVPEEGVLGYLGAGTFAALLPEVPVGEASSMLVGWDVAATSLLTAEVADATQGPRVSTALCEYRDGVFVGDREAKRPAHWLTSVRMQTPETPGVDGAAERVVIVDTEDLQDAAGPAAPSNGQATARPSRGAKRPAARKSSAARAKDAANAGAEVAGKAKTDATAETDTTAGRGVTPSGILLPGRSTMAAELAEARRKDGSHPADEAGGRVGPAGEGTTSAGQRG